MTEIRPIITYLTITVILSWLLLGAVTLPNANQWLAGEGYAIKEEFVYFNTSNMSTSPVIESSVSIEHGKKSLTLNVHVIENTPNVSQTGLKGILYDFGDACGNTTNLTPISPYLDVYKNISRIALVKQSGNCFLTDKIVNAQLNGAIGVIVYQSVNQSNSATEANRSLGVLPGIVRIPAYYVSYDYGRVLLRDVENAINKQNQTNIGQSELMVRVTLLPDKKPLMDRWQFALLIVGFMLLISIAAISFLQLRMWRTPKDNQGDIYRYYDHNNILTVDEQRHLEMEENIWRDLNGEIVQAPVKQRLDQIYVDLLPTRVFTTQQNEDLAEKLSFNQSKQEVNSIIDFEPTSCVICLDEFSEGDVLRRLPCCHEYHRDCIDIWLTKKSNACPLCLTVVQIPSVPAEVHSQDERAYDLAAAWMNLSSINEVALRRHPSAYNNNQLSVHQNSRNNNSNTSY